MLLIPYCCYLVQLTTYNFPLLQNEHLKANISSRKMKLSSVFNPFVEKTIIFKEKGKLVFISV